LEVPKAAIYRYFENSTNSFLICFMLGIGDGLEIKLVYCLQPTFQILMSRLGFWNQINVNGPFLPKINILIPLEFGIQLVINDP